MQRRPSNLSRSILLAAVVCGFFAGPARAGSWCGNPVPPCDPNNPLSPCYIPPEPDPRCEPKQCDKCTKSPCYTGTGVYTQTSTDLSLAAVGLPLTASRRYESSHMIDGPNGVGWIASLAAHLYFTTYLYAAPGTYQKEADVRMPDGAHYRFLDNGGSFTPPLGRYDTLVENADGSFAMVLERSSVSLHFGADGTLQTMTDEFGNQQIWTYDGNGRVQQVADTAGSGRFLSVFWGADGRISGLADSGGRQVSYVYDARGVLTNYYDALNRVTSYSYIAGRYAWMLNAVVDAWGRIVSQVTFDQEDRTHTYTENGETYTYTYGYQNNPALTAKADSTGATWVYTYGAAGLVSVATPPSASGVAPTYATFNADGSYAQRTDALGIVSLYVYDAAGRLTAETIDSQGPTAVRYEYSYDPNFPAKLAAVTPVKPSTGQVDPTWQAWRLDYYQAGDPAPGALHHVVRVESDGTTLDTTATYTYDTHGRPLSVTDGDGGTTTYAYDAQGNLATVTRPSNSDAGAPPVITYGYDALGRVTSKTDAMGLTTTYGLDAVGRFTAVTLSPPVVGSTLSYTETLAYDSFDGTTGLVFMSTADPNGSTSRSGRDAYGRVVENVDALGGVTRYTYSRDLLASQADANGNATAYAYDSLKRLTSTTFPDGTRESYTYYGDGSLKTKTDARNQTQSYVYDHRGRLAAKSYPSGASINYLYTGQSLTEVIDASVSPTETHTFAYDNSYRMAEETEGARGTLTYTYTPGDRKASYAVTGGASAAYGYYPDGSLDTIAWSPVSGLFKFTYNGRGDYEQVMFPNGQHRDYSYDNQGRLLQLANVHPAAGNLAAYDYGYDTDNATGLPGMIGLRSSVTATVPAQGLANALTRFYYDAAYRLTRSDYPAGAPFNGEVDQWTYDLLGNRLNSTVNGQGPAYTYQKVGANPNNWTRLTNDGTYSYSFDGNGSVASMSGVSGSQSFTWDYENRAATRSGLGSATAATYDYRSRLATLAEGGQTNHFLYRGDTPIQASGAAPESFLYGPLGDDLLATVQGGAVYFAVLDDHGSVIALADAAGTVHYNALYDVWGQVRSAAGDVQSLFGHVGGVADGGLWLNQVRYYSPAIGRFLQEDPGGMNSSTAQQWRATLAAARPSPEVAEPGPSPEEDMSALPHLNESGRSYPYGWNDPVVFRDRGGREVELIPLILIVILVYEMVEALHCEEDATYCTEACKYQACGACWTPNDTGNLYRGLCYQSCYWRCHKEKHCTRQEVWIVIREVVAEFGVHALAHAAH